MSSVLEKLGLKKKPNFTAIPRLNISSPLYALQIQSGTYFSIEQEAEAADGNQLAIKIIEGKNFSLHNEDQVQYLKDCTALVKEKAKKLHALDGKLLTCFIFAIVATALSFISLIGLIGFIGWGATIYFMNQRSSAYSEYKEALTLLAATCNWALGEGPEQRQTPNEELLKNETIRAMMKVLYPVLTEDQVKHLIADDIEHVFTEELKEYESRLKLVRSPSRLYAPDDKLALSKRSTEFYRCIYGLNKGSPVDYFDALLSLMPDLYRASIHGFQKFKYWCQKKSDPAETVVETPQTASPVTP